jgi:hypothetical protein
VAQLTNSPGAASKAPGLESLPQVLEFLQDLYCDSSTAERLPAFLRQYGIKIEPYQPADQAPEIQDHFDFEEGYGEGSITCTMLRPALLSDGQLLSRGRVVLPTT